MTFGSSFWKKGSTGVSTYFDVFSNLILQWLQKYVITKAGETRGLRTALFFVCDLSHLWCLSCLLVTGEWKKWSFLGKLENEKMTNLQCGKKRNLIFTKQKIWVLTFMLSHFKCMATAMCTVGTETIRRCNISPSILRLGTRPGNSSLARKIRVSGTKMTYSILKNSIQVITFFRVDISEVNYATCRYIIDKLQTHFPF